MIAAMEIISRAEAKAQGLKNYFTGKPCKRGHIALRRSNNAICVECSHENNVDYYKNNREKALDNNREWRRKNPKTVSEIKKRNRNVATERVRNAVYYEKNRDKVRARNRAWNNRNKESRAEYYIKWAQGNPELVNANNSKRRASRMSAIHPDWRYDEDEKRSVEEIYAEAKYLSDKTGIEHHVDHIVALQGADANGNPMRGPHVWWNLRPMKGVENMSKGNRVTDADIEEMFENLRQSEAGPKYIEAVRAQLGATHPKDWILPDYFS